MIMKRLFILAVSLLTLCGCSAEKETTPPGPPEVVYFSLEEVSAAYPDMCLPRVSGDVFTDATPYEDDLAMRYELPTGEAFVFRVFFDTDPAPIAGAPRFDGEGFLLYDVQKSSDDVDNVSIYLLVTKTRHIILRLFDQAGDIETYAQLITIE